jgi:hypothetical protein
MALAKPTVTSQRTCEEHGPVTCDDMATGSSLGLFTIFQIMLGEWGRYWMQLTGVNCGDDLYLTGVSSSDFSKM